MHRIFELLDPDKGGASLLEEIVHAIPGHFGITGSTPAVTKQKPNYHLIPFFRTANSNVVDPFSAVSPNSVPAN